MLRKLKAAVARRRKNAAASSAPRPRSSPASSSDSCPLNPTNPLGIHSPLHPINQTAYVNEPEPSRHCDDSHRSSWSSSSASESCSSDSSSSPSSD